MRRRFAVWKLLACWFGAAGVATLGLPGRSAFAADESPVTTAEIAHLMAYIRASNCQFLRNGAWHSPEAAHEHIATKLKYIRQRDTLRDAEQFIERAATRSSMTGETYQVRCPSSSALQDCSRWLLDELARDRGRSAQQR